MKKIINIISSSFIGRFNSTLCKLRSISRNGGHQLLNDVQILHSLLLEMPSLGSSINRKPPGKILICLRVGSSADFESQNYSSSAEHRCN